MFASDDVLYRIHLRQCVRRGLIPLAYAEFCCRLEGAGDTDLTQLLPPRSPPGFLSGDPIPGPSASEGRFELGRVIITRAAALALSHEDVQQVLGRHVRGDWGLLDAHDRSTNERALATGGRLVSVYQAQNGCRFYVITEAGHTWTTLLLPADY